MRLEHDPITYFKKASRLTSRRCFSIKRNLAVWYQYSSKGWGRQVDGMSDVKHDVNAQEFYVETPEGKALLHYEREGDVLNFHHTFVPPSLRGRGLAEEIVSTGFKYADTNHLKVIPSCPYVARLVMKNSDWKRLIVTK